MLMLNKQYKPPRRLKKPPRQRYPMSLEVAYYKKLRALLGEARRLVNQHLIPRLKDIIEQAGLKQDAAAWQGGDGGYIQNIESIFEYIKVQYYQTGYEADWSAYTDVLARDVSEHNKKEHYRQFKEVVAVNPFIAEPWLEGFVSSFVADNVKLIKSIPERYFSEIEDLVNRGVRAGRRHEDIATDIRARYGVSKNRAALIARDQVSKFNGDLNRVRQQAVGVSRYRWRTSLDERVRSRHQALEGTIQEWTKPPIVDFKRGRREHPGGDYRCRCTAEPIIEDVLGIPIKEDKN